MTAGSAPMIDWATADVRAGALSVAVAGDRPKGWRKHLKAVLELLDLDTGGWGEIRVRKGEILVTDVREGAEEDLRQMLEGAVLQANTDVGAGTAMEDGEPRAPDPREQADRRMTATFRSFAERGAVLPSSPGAGTPGRS